MKNVTFHDHKPDALSLYDAVADGLSRDNKSIPPKFFYDERGSELFDRDEAGRIEIHLVSRETQQLRVNAHCFRIEEGESLNTEKSYKYAPAEFLVLAFRSRSSRIDTSPTVCAFGLRIDMRLGSGEIEDER